LFSSECLTESKPLALANPRFSVRCLLLSQQCHQGRNGYTDRGRRLALRASLRPQLDLWLVGRLLKVKNVEQKVHGMKIKIKFMYLVSVLKPCTFFGSWVRFTPVLSVAARCHRYRLCARSLHCEMYTTNAKRNLRFQNKVRIGESSDGLTHSKICNLSLLPSNN
jgi:hypothetical protein